jgi:hypothetical protein
MRCATRLASTPAVRGQRPLHQQLADADAKAAAHQLGQQEASLVVELAPPAAHAPRDLVRRQAAQRQQPLLHPLGQADVRVSVARGSTWAMVSARSPTAW